jgi:hypothetical protein
MTKKLTPEEAVALHHQVMESACLDYLGKKRLDPNLTEEKRERLRLDLLGCDLQTRSGQWRS